MEVIFLRHGAAAANLEKRFLGVTDQPLCPEGVRAARAAGERAPRVDHVYMSPLLRCRETAELVWPGVDKTAVKALRESNFGPFEGKSHAELSGDPLYEAWLADGGKTFTLGGMETPDHVLRRVSAGVSYILRDGAKRGFRAVAVVGHGGAFMALLARFARPQRPYYDWLLPNCGGYVGELEGSPLRIRITGEF